MTTEALQHKKEPTLPLKILDILSTIPINQDYWVYHEEIKPTRYINPQGKQIGTNLIEKIFTTKLETISGIVSVSIMQQSCDMPNVNYPYVLRLVNTGDEDYPIEYVMESDETDQTLDESHLAHVLFNNLKSVLIESQPVKQNDDKQRVKETITNAIDELYVETFS